MKKKQNKGNQDLESIVYLSKKHKMIIKSQFDYVGEQFDEMGISISLYNHNLPYCRSIVSDINKHYAECVLKRKERYKREQ